MPTFPLPSLKFRTAGFPQYGFKAGVSDSAFPTAIPVKPAPGIPFVVVGLHLSFVLAGTETHFSRSMPRRIGQQAPPFDRQSRSTPGVLAPVRVVVSRSIIT